jgi:tryptophanase
VKDIFGHTHVIPTHQGRAAEKFCSSGLPEAGRRWCRQHPLRHHPGQHRGTGATALDLPIPEAKDMGSEHPFKGNIDLGRAEGTLLARNTGPPASPSC